MGRIGGTDLLCIRGIMSTQDDKKNPELDFLLACLKTQGAAASTVKDGHIVMFKRSMLQALLDKNTNNDTFVIFVKRPEFKN